MNEREWEKNSNNSYNNINQINVIDVDAADELVSFHINTHTHKIWAHAYFIKHVVIIVRFVNGLRVPI